VTATFRNTLIVLQTILVVSLTDPNSCQPPNMMQLIDSRMKSCLETVMVPGVSRTASGRRPAAAASRRAAGAGSGGVKSEGGA
jgi:hypothetical protein